VTSDRDTAAPPRAPATAPPPDGGAVRARNRLVVLLALVSGATDAVGFLALGSAFTSVMTGNMVLVGVAVGSGDTSALGLTLAAIVGYIVGAAGGVHLAGRAQPGDGPWPAGVSRALLVELALLTTYAVGWWAHGGNPPSSWFGPLLAVNSMALGVQSSAILRFGVSGLSTTYLTGTLTTVVTRIATRQPLTSVGHSATLLGALICGAAVGAGLVTHARMLTPVFQVGLLGVVLVAVLLDDRLRSR
jgi:uncharacterized membrane protein YoaK (UPF0700 family)